MKRGILGILLVLAIGTPAHARQGYPPASFAQPAGPLRAVDMVVLPPVDTGALRAEDERAAAEGRGGPARFAAVIPVALDCENSGTWETLPDGSRLWRLRVVSPGAYSLNFGFHRFRLPEGATVHFYAAGAALALPGEGPSGGGSPGAPSGDVSAGASTAVAGAWDGPYEASDASPDGQFWTAVIPGDDAVIELRLPPNAAFEPELAVAQVGHDYGNFAGLTSRLLGGEKDQGRCNNDVVCPEGGPWRNEIRSVACYSINGSMACSGMMVNSHDLSRPPYFLTANHCNVNSGNAATVVLYFNYQSPTCGALSGGSRAQHQSGVEWKANYATSDFCLVRLLQAPSPEFNVYFAGWDARDETRPASAVAIHHPQGLEKAISFCNTPLTLASYLQDPAPGDGTHWRVNHYDDGTTEPGSSGCGLWDPSHRVVGQLHGGPASCDVISSDYYGRLSRSWNGGGVSSSQLKFWLDPANSGVLFLDGRNWDGASTLLGDADTSRAVDSQDLVAIARHVLGTQLIGGQGLLNADYNYDGRLSVVDLVGVVNIILQGGSLAGGAGSSADVVPAAGNRLNPAGGAWNAAGTAGVLRLAASFDSAGRQVVFTMTPAAPPAPADRGLSRPTGPAAISLELATDPGAFAPGPLPVRFPAGSRWQGLAVATADGAVRAVLYDPEAGAAEPPPSFAIPAGRQGGEVRWAGGDAADGFASMLRLDVTGFPLRVGSADGPREPARASLAVQPNPARGACTLRFDLPIAAEASVSLFDPAGRLVLSRNLGRVAAGSGVVELSGRDTATLGPGLYFVRLTLDGRPEGTARLIVAR